MSTVPQFTTLDPQAVFVCIINTEDPSKLVLFKRNKDGQIGFPGGKIDPEDESLIAAGIREVHEETGLMLSPDDFEDVQCPTVLAKGKVPVTYLYATYDRSKASILEPLEEFKVEGTPYWGNYGDVSDDDLYHDINSFAIFNYNVIAKFALDSTEKFLCKFMGNKVATFTPAVMKLAITAGTAIKQLQDKALEVEYKEDESPVTAADKLGSSIIKMALKHTGYDILDEETGLTKGTNDGHFWCIDPLDGTKEFIKGDGDYTVNIALINSETGKVTLSVVYAPVSGNLYVSGQGVAYMIEGLFFGELIDDYSTFDATSNALTNKAVGSKSNFNKDTASLIKKLMGNEDYELVSAGSSLKFCSIAEGKADLYARTNHLNIWDIAAAVGVAESAGCIVTDLEGNPLRFKVDQIEQPGFICSNPNLKL